MKNLNIVYKSSIRLYHNINLQCKYETLKYFLDTYTVLVVNKILKLYSTV